MAGREVTSDDGPLLEQFRCADPERPWESEVEDAVHDSLLWISERSGRFVRLFNLGEEIAVVIGYEYVNPVSEEEGFYIPFLAVASGLQGNELAGEALDELMEILREESFGGPITCRIEIRNLHSRKFVQKKNFVLVEDGSDHPDYQLWRSGG